MPLFQENLLREDRFTSLINQDTIFENKELNSSTTKYTAQQEKFEKHDQSNNKLGRKPLKQSDHKTKNKNSESQFESLINQYYIRKHSALAVIPQNRRFRVNHFKSLINQTTKLNNEKFERQITEHKAQRQTFWKHDQSNYNIRERRT